MDKDTISQIIEEITRDKDHIVRQRDLFAYDTEKKLMFYAGQIDQLVRIIQDLELRLDYLTTNENLREEDANPEEAWSSDWNE